MISYSITGNLPATWEDFLSRDARYPNITILTRADADDSGFDGDGGLADDGWLDIVVNTDVICADIARLAIAEALGIDNPEDIVIEQQGWCQAV